MSPLTKARRYLDYYVPREVMGPVVIVFSVENVVDILFEHFMPFRSELIGWGLILVASIAAVTYWGNSDEDKQQLEKELEDGNS